MVANAGLRTLRIEGCEIQGPVAALVIGTCPPQYSLLLIVAARCDRGAARHVQLHQSARHRPRGSARAHHHARLGMPASLIVRSLGRCPHAFFVAVRAQLWCKHFLPLLLIVLLAWIPYLLLLGFAVGWALWWAKDGLRRGVPLFGVMRFEDKNRCSAVQSLLSHVQLGSASDSSLCCLVFAAGPSAFCCRCRCPGGSSSCCRCCPSCGPGSSPMEL